MPNVVVLPAPFGPSRPTTSPAETSSDTSRTTVRPLYRLGQPLRLQRRRHGAFRWAAHDIGTVLSGHPLDGSASTAPVRLKTRPGLVDRAHRPSACLIFTWAGEPRSTYWSAADR